MVVEITVYDGVTKFDHSVSVLPKNIKRTSFSSCVYVLKRKKKKKKEKKKKKKKRKKVSKIIVCKI